MRKVFAIVRIVHHLQPEQLTLDELAERYQEAVYYMHTQAEINAQKMSSLFGESE